jgi:hypothetical protein
MPNVEGLNRLSVFECRLVAIKELTLCLRRHLRAYLVRVFVQFTCNSANVPFLQPKISVETDFFSFFAIKDFIYFNAAKM